MLGTLGRDGIERLIREAYALHQRHRPYDHIVQQLETETGFPDVADFMRATYFFGDEDAAYVAERLALHQPTGRQLSREEMIALVQRIMTADGSEAEIDLMVSRFENNCRHPAGTDLIFWPNLVPGAPAGWEPTTEEIVDLALSEPDR